MDEYGLPVVDYGRRLGVRLGRRPNATTLGIVGLKATQSASLVGLAGFDRTGDEIVSRVSLEKVARWLLDSSVDKGDYMIYHVDFPWPTYALKPPWRSCLAEAFAGTFLLVFGIIRKDQSCVDCGLKHLRSLLVPVSQGGLKSDDSRFFLEYVGYERRKRWPVVLNGHLYCLITLSSVSRTLGVPEFGVAFEQAMSGLDSLLPIFEGPFFTYYDNYGNPAKLFYHELHIHLLEKLYGISKLSYLRTTAERWRAMSPKYNFTLALLTRAYSMRIPYLPRR
jgi:hypothetical protein